MSAQETLLEYLNKNGCIPPFKYDIRLLKLLNNFYKAKPVVSHPRKLDIKSRQRRGKNQAAPLIEFFPTTTSIYVLEFGCNRGDTAAYLAQNSKWDVTGIDIQEYHNEWAKYDEVTNLHLIAGDLTDYIEEYKDKFDFIYSLVTLEHVLDPQNYLKLLYLALKDNGILYFSANLYRGAIASHIYRQIYFPYPHLLFEDSVFAKYFSEKGQSILYPAWVNKMTHLHYLDTCKSLGFKICDTVYWGIPYDEEFIAAFADKLGKYPSEDLKIDIMKCTLQKI